MSVFFGGGDYLISANIIKEKNELRCIPKSFQGWLVSNLIALKCPLWQIDHHSLKLINILNEDCFLKMSSLL